MNTQEMKTWFAARSADGKIAALASLMHHMTLVVRDAYYNANQPGYRQISYFISEMNHRLTAKIKCMITGDATYSDDDLIEIIADGFKNAGLENQLISAWNSIVHSIEQRAA